MWESHVNNSKMKKKKRMLLQSCSIKLSENVYIYYTQIKSKSQKSFERYVGPKGPSLDQKGPKMVEARFFPDCKH